MNISLEKIFEEHYEEAINQKNRLIKIWEKGGTIPLIIERAATDDHPVADLVSEEFVNWRFQLSRRLCVKGFLHKQKVGTQLELYIDGFGEDQVVFVSYVKKDLLAVEVRDEIIKELRKKLHDDKGINEKIESLIKEVPIKVKIHAVLNDHIIVEYKEGFYGTMTASDLFHSKSAKDMVHYKNLQKIDGTMKVYVNTIDSTGNVSFSETRMPELCNNDKYVKNEVGQSKWINKEENLENLSDGDIIECIVWHYSNNGLFVLFKNNGGYVQSLIPNTALTEQDILQWAKEHPLNSRMKFRIVNINLEHKRVTLFPTDVVIPKYKEKVELEKRTKSGVDENVIAEGQQVEIELICESRINQDILYAQCGEYRGIIYVKEDLPDCLRHETINPENGKVKRSFITNVITRNNGESSSISFPAIAHIITDSNNNKIYNFSVVDACSRYLEFLNEKDVSPSYREVEIVLSWPNPFTNERLAILRWNNLYTFYHFDQRDLEDLDYDGSWESGSKLMLWINGIDQDLSFEAETKDPRTYWDSLNICVGNFVIVNKIWLSRMGVYRAKYDGCTATILPDFKLDEEQIEYHLKVVFVDKKKQLLILSDGSHQLLSGDDIEELPANLEENRTLHLLMPLNKNIFLAEDKESKKRTIIQTSPTSYAFLCVIYNYFNIGTFVHLPENNEVHFKYRDYSFPCNYINTDNVISFEWIGQVIKTTSPKFNETFSDVLEKKGIEKVGWYYNNTSYDFTCKKIIKCKIIESERNEIKNWSLYKLPKPKVYFTGKILYNNHRIFPLFSFKDPNLLKPNIINANSTPFSINCRVVGYDEAANCYIVNCGEQRGLLQCREKKELRYLPGEIVKGIYDTSINKNMNPEMPYLRTLEILSKKKLVYDNVYSARIIGRRADGVVMEIVEYNKRIFIPNKRLFTTKKEYDSVFPNTIMDVRYKGRGKNQQTDYFELAQPPTQEKRPQKGYECKITILSKNERDYDAYINGGEFDGIMGYLPSNGVYFYSGRNTTSQILLPGDTIDAIVDEKYGSVDIIFKYPYKKQFKKGLLFTGTVISEDDDKYIISIGNIYGITTDKSEKLLVGRMYKFSILSYVLKNIGPQLTINNESLSYNVLLKVNPVLKRNNEKKLLAQIVGYDNSNIYLEMGIYKLYAKINEESSNVLFINRFGKVVIPLGTEVYVLPKDTNDEMFINSTEVYIIKIK